MILSRARAFKRKHLSGCKVTGNFHAVALGNSSAEQHENRIYYRAQFSDTSSASAEIEPLGTLVFCKITDVNMQYLVKFCLVWQQLFLSFALLVSSHVYDFLLFSFPLFHYHLLQTLGKGSSFKPVSALPFSAMPEIEYFSECEVRASVTKCQLLLPVYKYSASVI